MTGHVWSQINSTVRKFKNFGKGDIVTDGLFMGNF